MKNEYGRHIEIEMMMFGDYRVQVWDERLDSLLDREYFVRGWGAAVFTAISIQDDLFPELSIYNRVLGTVSLLRNPIPKKDE